MKLDRWLNENPYEHISSNGTRFTSDRCDFRTGVLVEKPDNITEERYLQDIGEFVGYHFANIWENLNGFSGYAAISYTITTRVY